MGGPLQMGNVIMRDYSSPSDWNAHMGQIGEIFSSVPKPFAFIVNQIRRPNQIKGYVTFGTSVPEFILDYEHFLSNTVWLGKC
jgi:hypothetical protein